MKPGSGDRGPGSGGRSEAHELRLGDHEGADETVKRTSAGKAYWRSLDDLADTPEFRALVEKEFPGLAEELLSPRTRRAFLKVMGASLGVAGLAACRWPKETILPFAHRPEDRIPGVPQQYATAMELAGAAVGLLVTSYDGRPVKIEGNPLHPTSRGAASALAQASLLELYDPDRSQQVVRRDGGQAFPSSVGRVRGVRRPALRGAAGEERRRPHRAVGGELLAEPRPAAAALRRAVSGGEVGSRGRRSPATTAARRRRGCSGSRCGRCCASTGPTWSSASTPTRSSTTRRPWRTRATSPPGDAARAAR